MITVATETIDIVWEYKEHLYKPMAGREWTGLHTGYSSEAEAVEGIRKFLRNWVTGVDLRYRSSPPREFRITRIETHKRILAMPTADEAGELSE